MKNISEAKHIITPDGLTIPYWVSWQPGQGDDFTIFHNASSMNHSSMEPLEKGLNDAGHPTIIFDQRGVGFADKPTDESYYTLARHSSDLQQIIEQEGLQNPTLVGYSYGFMPSVDCAVRTGNADKIVGICGSYNLSETARNKIVTQAFNHILRYAQYLASIGFGATHALRGEPRPFPEQSALKNKSHYHIWRSMVDVPTDETRAQIASGKAAMKWDITRQLRELKTPLILIYGKQDPMVVPETGEKIKALTEASCDIYMLDGTHALPLMTPQNVLNLVVPWSKSKN